MFVGLINPSTSDWYEDTIVTSKEIFINHNGFRSVGLFHSPE